MCDEKQKTCKWNTEKYFSYSLKGENVISPIALVKTETNMAFYRRFSRYT